MCGGAGAAGRDEARALEQGDAARARASMKSAHRMHSVTNTSTYLELRMRRARTRGLRRFFRTSLVANLVAAGNGG